MGCRLMLIMNAGRQIDYRQKMAMKAAQESRPGRGKAAARRLFLDASIFRDFPGGSRRVRSGLAAKLRK